MATSGQDLGFTSPDEAGFNGLTFIENLKNILFKSIPPTNTSQPAYVGMNTEATAQSKSLNFFFQQFSTSTTRLPTTWDDFMSTFRAYLGGSDPGSTAGAAYTGFLNEYRNIIGYPGDWSAVTGASAADIAAQFQDAFTHFIARYPYKTNPPNPQSEVGTVGNALDFFTQWHTYLTGTAVLNDTGTPVTVADISSYRQIYEAFFPGGDFDARLEKFYQDVLKFTSTTGDGSNGYFIPSQQFYNWFEQVQQEYSRSLSGASGPLITSVSTSSTKKVLILDRLFRLLVSMIESLQGVAAAQADRLSFLSQWQKSYTDVMNQVPTFIRANGMPSIDRGGGSDPGARDDLNRLNSTFTEQLRSNRSIVGDDAKALQSNVNQSNDAVTQQSDLTTALIQQMSTILGAIFR